MGCFWQIVSISKLFFSFPTNIFIDTEFDVFEIPLPSVTFCTDITNRSNGKTSQELFDTFKLNQTVLEIGYLHQESDETQNLFDPDQIIQAISMTYYCFTFNSYKQGKLFTDTLIIINYQHYLSSKQINEIGAKWLFEI